MSFLSKLFGGGASSSGEPHAVLMHVVLPGDDAAREEALGGLSEMEVQAAEAVGRAGAGEAKPAGLVEGAWEVWYFGADAEKIWQALMPVLETKPFRKGSRVTKYFGVPGQAREERVNLHYDG